MDPRKDIQEFLVSRRARLTPDQVGLPTYGDKRRVKGLRREEVALLAGVSMDYYGRLERGQLAGASEAVLDSLAGALRLDDAERQHLFDLARITGTTPRTAQRAKSSSMPRPAVLAILTSMTGVPAYLRNARMDVVAANDLCQALYDGTLDDDRLPLNLARYIYLEPHSRGFFLDWDDVADDLTGALRIEAGRDPQDRALTDLIGELSTRSATFATRWARQNVRIHRTARKRLHNRVVGDLELTGDALELTSDGLTLIAYTADPGSEAADQLRLLASWRATQADTSSEAHSHVPHHD